MWPSVDTYDDPGWRKVWRYLPLWLLPIQFVATALVRRAATDGITRLRSVYLRMLLVPFLFLVVLYVISNQSRPQRVLWMPAAVALVGLADFGSLSRLRQRRLFPNPQTERAVASAYGATMMIGIGRAEVPMLLGFVGFFLTDRLWSYLVGMGFSLACMALIAPTRADIERRQLELTERGSTLSLGDALLRFQPRRRSRG
jgi:ABC-type transport system involved in cytochrome c biogenesis permease subunit